MAFLIHAPRALRSTRRGRTREVEQLLPRVYRLALSPHAFLYPYSVGQLEWRGDALALSDGIYWQDPAVYLAVEGDRGTSITEAQALVRLGALNALLALGLEDAAISLQSGDLVNARHQWLRYRDGRS